MSCGDQNDGNAVADARNEAEAQPLPVQPRQPRNLQGLLRFAMEATKAEDAPGNSEFTPMDEERRKFLEEALRGLTVNMAEVLEKDIRILTNTERLRSIQLGEELPADVAAAFEEVQEMVENIDVANDFHKMGGFAMFPICFGSENEHLRARACSTLGVLCQNNPYCQAEALQCGLLSILVTMIQSEQGEVLAKCVYALSCACREYDPSCRELISQDGCQALAKLVRAEDAGVRTKAAFFIRYLAHTYPSAKQLFLNVNIIRDIGEQIKIGRDWATEHLLSVISILVEGKTPTALQQCLDPHLNLKGILSKLLQHPDLQDDSFREEKAYAETLYKRIANCPEVDRVFEEADR